MNSIMRLGTSVVLLVAWWSVNTSFLQAQEAVAGSTRWPAAGPLRVHPKNPRYFTEGPGTTANLTGVGQETFTYNGRNLRAGHTTAPGSAIAATESWTYYLDGRQYAHTDFRGPQHDLITITIKTVVGEIGAYIYQVVHTEIRLNVRR